MRIKRMTIDGFRAFGSRYEFDLDAGAVLLEGANGQGKTSFFDAILWCLTGTVPRLETKGDSAIVSRYTRTGESNVILELDGTDGPLSISRWTNGTDEKLVLKEASQDSLNPHAEVRLLDRLWPGTARSSGEPFQSVASAFTRSVYLQQDRLRDFLEADSDHARFAAISELVGTGRVTDLQEDLAKARTAWSKRLNQTKSETEKLAREVAQLRAAVEEIGDDPAPGLRTAEMWEAWWKRAQRHVDAESIPQLTQVDAASLLEGKVRALSVRQRSLRTRVDTADRVVGELTRQLDEKTASASELEVTVHQLREETEAREQELEAATADLKKAREARRDQLAAIVQSRDRKRRLNALAELAIDLLTERCPVCHQEIDRDSVHMRLRELMDAKEDQEFTVPDNELSELEQRVGTTQATLNGLRESLARQESQLRFISSRQGELEDDLRLLGVETAEPSVDLVEKVRAVAEEARRELEVLGALISEAERLALSQARLAERSRLRDLKRELEEKQRELADTEEDIRRRDRTGNIANALVSRLEEVAAELVSRRLDELGPMLQRIYSRMDPHPSFRDVSLVAKTHYGKGRITAEVADRVEGVVVEDPHLVLSSSQSNVLALSIFLTLNLGTQVPLAVTLLDDPVQSLDDVNLLGLTDLLRRVRDRRQVVLSTHDGRLAALLARKLRPVKQDQSVRLLRFEGWARQGPSIQISEGERGSGRLRVVA